VSQQREALEQARRYIDSVLEIDKQAGQQSEVPNEVYEQAVRRIARVTRAARNATRKASSE
jgi:hypothetical protein